MIVEINRSKKAKRENTSAFGAAVRDMEFAIGAIEVRVKDAVRNGQGGEISNSIISQLGKLRVNVSALKMLEKQFERTISAGQA